jgi:predicted secreted protein
MSALKSMGTKLYLVGTPDVQIADLTSIGEFGIESEEIDVTTLDSADGFREFIAGLKDGGEIAISGIVKSESNMEDLLDLADDQTVESWEVRFTSGSEWAFDGFVKMFKEGESTIEGVRNFNMSIRISGKPDYTPVVVSA